MWVKYLWDFYRNLYIVEDEYGRAMFSSDGINWSRSANSTNPTNSVVANRTISSNSAVEDAHSSIKKVPVLRKKARLIF